MLTTDDLVEGIQQGLPVGPVSISPTVIERQISLIREKRLQLEPFDDLFDQFHGLIAGPLEIVRPSVIDALHDAEIYILPLPLCMAWSQRRDERRIIVIGSGLIDLVISTGYSARFSASLAPQVAGLEPLDQLPGCSLAYLLDLALFSLLRDYFQKGASLPNFRDVATPNLHKDVHIASAGGLLAVLLHELGHLELGHSADSAVRGLDLTHLIDEEISPRKQQELDADQYAVRAIEHGLQEFGKFWLNIAFDFFTRLDVNQCQFSVDHPLTLNRVAQGNELEVVRLGFYDSAARRTHLAKLAASFSAAGETANREDSVYEVDAKVWFILLAKLQPLLMAGGLDIATLLKGPGEPWYERSSWVPV